MINRISIKLFSLTILFMGSVFLHGSTPAHGQTQGGYKKSKIPKSDSICIKALTQSLSGKKGKISFPKQCPVAQKIFLWETYRKSPPEASFAEITSFITENPTWPNALLMKRAEEALNDKTSPQLIIRWFSKNPPRTVRGCYYYAKALLVQKNLKKSQKGLLKALVQKTWQEYDFEDNNLEQSFWKMFKNFLTQEDHLGRLNRLIIQEKISAVQRLKNFLKPPYPHLIDVRVAFLQDLKHADTLFKKLPAKLKALPGMVHSRIKWLRKREQYHENSEAYVLLKHNFKSPFLSETLWQDRHILVRDAIRDKFKAQDIYHFLKNHGLEEGGDFSDAEFLAGFIALKFLKKPDIALVHFEKLYEGVKTPISKTRAAYWAGRAANDVGEKKLALHWWAKAAEHPTTFYGQEALKKLKKPLKVKLLSKFPVNLKKRKAFESESIVKGIRLLKDSDHKNFLPTFLDHMAMNSKNKDESALILELTEQTAPTLCVPIARTLARNGGVLLRAAYPMTTIPRHLFGNYLRIKDKAFILSIIRKESGFNVDQKSSAGAIGLMQILEPTAHNIVLENKLPALPVNVEQHLKNPKHNMKLGCVYLDNLFEWFDGSLPLIAAAYNAGPGTVRKWIKTYGDPRTGEVDEVEWVELIPYGETRNYVHRVMEAYRIYQSHLGESITKRTK